MFTKKTNKIKWPVAITILFLTLFVDQASKSLLSNTHLFTIGSLQLFPVHNHGVMLGLFSTLPTTVRAVFLVTFGSFLLCCYFISLYLFASGTQIFWLSLTLVMGGILGNIADRILHDYVIDFLSLQFGAWHSPVFNLADFFQWIGYALLLYSFFVEKVFFGANEEKRHSFWINPRFQKKYILIHILSSLLLSGVCAIFAYTYIRFTLTELQNSNPVIDRILWVFIVCYCLICLICCGLSFVLARILSHRIAGPVFAFERYARSLMVGNATAKQLRLRSADEFQELEQLAADLNVEILRLRSIHKTSG